MRNTSVARFIEDIGQVVRETRIAAGLSQREVARRSSVSQSVISRIERGSKRDLRVSVLDRLFVALDVRYWLGTERGRTTRPTADLVHARCSAYVARRLTASGWIVRREVEVGNRGSSGWIDILAFHHSSRLQLVIEIKTEIQDIGAIERALNWYVRGSMAVANGLGWRPRETIGALVVLQSRSTDDRIAESRDVFRLAFPGRAAQLAAVITGNAQPSHDRFLAMIDPRSRRVSWLRASRTDGRRTPCPYADYIDAARQLDAKRGRRRAR